MSAFSYPKRFAGGGGKQSVAVAVAQFALTGLVAVAVLGFVGVQVLTDLGHSEAIKNAKRETQLAGRGIVAPELGPALLSGQAAAVREPL